MDFLIEASDNIDTLPASMTENFSPANGDMVIFHLSQMR